jgi:hypothetical protein
MESTSHYFKKGDHAMTGFAINTVLRTMPGLSRLKSVEEIRKAPAVRKPRAPKKEDKMRLKALAEAVILQSIEDLWSTTNRRESIEFFEGEGFRHCADMAGMKVVERLQLIRMLRKLNAVAFKTKHARKLSQLTTV